MADLDPAVVSAEAERKVRLALELVEQAQHTLERACQELSAVTGAAPDYGRIGSLAEKVHAAWRRLAYVKPKAGYGLDEFGLQAIEKVEGRS